MDEKWVLIVDDEESILSVLKNSLKKFGPAFQVITANSGAAALEQLSQRIFDLVVTDYRMEDMNGLELLEAVRAIQPDTRVILMTAYGSNALEAEARQLKAYNYLTKPLEIDSFRQVVKEALGNLAISRPGILILSDERYQQVNNLITQLRSDIGAWCIFLTDSEGHFIAQTGEMSELPLQQIACLVGGGVASLLEVGRIIDGTDDTVNLCYREGKQVNLYVVNIGRQLLLVIICEVGPYASRLGSVWYFAQRTALALREKLGEAEHASPYPLFNHEINQELDSQFDQLFAETAPPQASTARDEVAPAPETPDLPAEELLSFEQAIAKGIVPKEFSGS
ncbi:MAG: response regulator [Chloroflexota bacterium]